MEGCHGTSRARNRRHSARPAKPADAADSPSPAMRGIVFAVLLSLPVWAVAGYVAFRLL